MLALSGLVSAIRTQEVFFAKTIPVVAKIVRTKGQVVFRSEAKVRWNSASLGSQLFDGDRVSTGLSSSTYIEFNDGRKLTLGEDSQIAISTITYSEGGMTFLVDLVKGSLVADSKKNCAKCRDLVLRSGGESFNVGKGEKQSFFRDIATNKIKRKK